MNHTHPMKIAIIGTGISGLGAAYLLNPHHDITVYEKNDYLGGHSRTIDITANSKSIAVDTGFIVFNYRNYPHLTKLFERLQVPVQKSDMSFGASIADGWIEYGSKNIFSQKKNFFRPSYWQMLADILRFNKQALRYLETRGDATMAECLDDLRMGTWFRRYYIQAMGAAIWSCSVDTILKFPARSFIRFFDNHGLLTVRQHPQWFTVTGGSRIYIEKLSAEFRNKIKINCGVAKVVRQADGRIAVHDTDGNTAIFDRVVFSCHADEALRMIDTPTIDEKSILGSFTYQPNRVVVHGDTSFMPRQRTAWASWVYLSETVEDKSESVSLSYWMNNLQGIDRDVPVIITLNPGRRPDESLIYNEHEFSHPVFTTAAVNAQQEIDKIQGANEFWFCGAYQRYGFHEDGLLSAVNMVRKMGHQIPWE